jgi:hypothetical protein
MWPSVVKLILAFVAGLLISIGVAWYASAQQFVRPPALGPPASAHGKYIPAAVYQGTATELVYIDWYGLAPGVNTDGAPLRADWYPERSASHAGYTCVIAQASGWPMLCLWREHLKLYDPTGAERQFRWVNRGSIPLDGQLKLPDSTGTLAIGAQPAAALPLLPLWPGLLFDSVFYACVTGGAGVVLGRIGRWLRIAPPWQYIVRAPHRRLRRRAALWSAVVVLAAAAAFAVPLLLTARSGTGPTQKMEIYRSLDNTLWHGRSAPGYSAILIRDLDRRRVLMVSTWGDQFPVCKLPEWFERSVEGVRERGGQPTDDYLVEAFGWPLPALARTQLLGQGGSALPTTSANPIVEFVSNAPREVLWKGMLIDAALFAAVLFGLRFFYIMISLGRRSSRGACLACGYDRHGLAGAHACCPECGAIPA